MADAIDAANAHLTVELGRDQVRAHQVSPEVFRQREAEIGAQISRLRSKWSGTLYRWTFNNAYDRALKDPIYRYQALSDYDRSPSWSLFPASLSGSEVAQWIVEGLLVLLVIGVILAVIRFANRPKPAPQPIQPDTTHGSADWAQPTAVAPDTDDVFSGVFFGKESLPELADVPLEEHQGAPVYGEKKNHAIICAQTRTGKGTKVIQPTLLRYGVKGPGRPAGGSVFCIDPKGENFAVSARARRDLGSDVHIINPWGEFAALQQQYGFPAATFNPLDILDRNDPNVVSTAQSIAAAICPQEASGKDAFWNRNAANILTAVLLWLTDQPTETKTLGRAREILTRPKKDFQANFLSHMVNSKVFGGAISEHAAPFDGMAQETYSGIMSNVQQYTTFLSDQQVKAGTASSSFSMRDLITKPTTVYLVIPFDKLSIQRTWLRLLLIAALHVYKHHGSSNVNRCLFLIDEMPALGRIDELSIATMAGYGVDYLLVTQTLDDLRNAYGNAGYGAIMSNCAYKWFCNVSDLVAADYLSKSLGNQTVATTSSSTSTSHSPGGGSSGTSTSHSTTGRPLLMPDEILKLGRDTAIFLAPGSKPRYLRTVNYWDLAKAFPTVKQYKEPPLKWDENPLPH